MFLMRKRRQSFMSVRLVVINFAGMKSKERVQ